MPAGKTTLTDDDVAWIRDELGLPQVIRGQAGVLVAEGRSLLKLDPVPGQPTSDQQQFDQAVEELYRLQEGKEALKQEALAARRRAYAERENARGSRVQYELGSAPTRVSEQPFFTPVTIEIPSAVSEVMHGVGDVVTGGVAALADMTVAPVLDLAQAGAKALHGLATGDFQPLVPLSSYGNSVDSGAALKAVGVNVFNVSPVGMIYHAGTGGYGVTTAAMNGDVRGATREAVGLGLNFAGARAMGFDRYGFVINDIAATGPGRYQRGSIGLRFGEIPQVTVARASGPTPLDPILQAQKDISIATQKKSAAVDRWLRGSDSRVAQAYRDALDTSPNFASMIRGRVIDRRMNAWFRDNFGNVPGVRIDQQIPGSGTTTRPDLYLPNLGGKSVIFDVGGTSKITGIQKYEGLADYLFPITH